MYPDYQPYPYQSPPYSPPPPPPPFVPRRTSALRVGMSALSLLLSLCVTLVGMGLIFTPQLVARLLPFAATRVTGTIYGESMAQREAGSRISGPLPHATITCGGVSATTDAHGAYTLSVLRGRNYSCKVSAPLHTSVTIRLTAHTASAFALDLGPTLASADSSAASDCVVRAARQVCPPLALVPGVLSGQVIDNKTYAPIANATVICWDDSATAKVSADQPTRYSVNADQQGHYTLRDTPPGFYLCVANRQGAPQRAHVAPASVTTANFSVCGSHCSGLDFHDGPVMHTFTAYVIYWAPPSAPLEPGGANDRFQSLVSQYLNDVGGTSFYGLLTQYWDETGPVRNVSTLGGTYFDSQPYPQTGTRSDPLSDDNITAEINRVRAIKGWKVTPSSAFIVVTGYNIQECAKFGNGTACSYPTRDNNGFCAYHGFSQISLADTGGEQDYYPYMYLANNADCSYLPTFDYGPTPYGDQYADSVINSLSHEQFESVTDPQSHGWYDGDPSGGEIGDKCETTFGSTDGSGANVTLNNGHGYVLQEEYSDLAGGCAYQE